MDEWSLFTSSQTHTVISVCVNHNDWSKTARHVILSLKMFGLVIPAFPHSAFKIYNASFL